MGSLKELRPYQRQAIDALYAAWRSKSSDASLIVIPTAGGKSLIIAKIIEEILTKWATTRILLLSHVKELVSQDHLEYGGGGIFSAGLNRKELNAQVLFASIQSIEKHVHKLFPAPEILFIDEAHLLSRKENTRYQKVIKTLKTMYPHLKIIGLSATPYRLDSGWLHLGEGAIFDKIVYEVGPQTLIDQGYLSPLTTKSGIVKINTQGIKHIGKEFVSRELERRAMEGNTTELAVADIIKRSTNRKKWLIFACGIDHCEQINSYMIFHGIKSDIITGLTKNRDEIINEFKNGNLQCIVNCDVLTTGFNFPPIDFIAMLRPTESPGLYVQICGRGMRISPGKTECLILDYAGNVMRHGPIDAINPTQKKEGSGDGLAPCKECPECMSIIAAGFRECPDCGYEFPPPEKDIQYIPSESAILKAQIAPTKIIVKRTTFSHYKKQGSDDTIKVEYHSFLTSICEWKKPSPTGFYKKFCKELGLDFYPSTVEDFLKAGAKCPKEIYVIPNGRFYEVTKRVLDV